MKYTFSQKPITQAPHSYVRIRITEEKKQPRFILEKKVATIEIGVGKWKAINRRKFILLCRQIIQIAQQHKVEKCAVEISQSSFPQLKTISSAVFASLIGENFEMARYTFKTYKTAPKNGWKEIKEVSICGKSSKEMQGGFKKGVVVGELVNECRSISNTPGGDMTPALLAACAKKLSRNTKVSVSVLGKKAMTKLKMGGILGVAKGTIAEPKFIVMKYFGGKKGEQPIVLAGKGVTFDTGGINIKPSDALLGMHLDMSGGAAVIATVALVGKLKLKKNVIGLIPAVENSVSSESYRPGDVLTSMSGKTIEVLNTDAEGRIVLADALTYAKQFKPKVLIDVATLTGAALVALGQRASAVMTRDETLEEILCQLGEETGDYLWSLPLWEDYEEEVRGTVGDVTNLSTKNARYGGAINGGIFLLQFAKEHTCPWAHIDIAPRMTTIPSDNLAPGAAGEPVRLLTRLIETYPYE